MLREHGYHGWISLEFERDDESRTAVPAGLDLLRRRFS
jgi:hypothetical protein